MPRTGRPPTDNPRTVLISIRLTPDEAAKLTSAAETAGKPLTAYIRDRALAAAKRAR